MNLPKVSVALNVYNGEDTIDRAIQSIVNQTMNDWELIIVDDCSSDSTPEKLRAWEMKDSRIKVFRNKENHQIVVARNDCFEQASGEYIAIMDADDVCKPERLQVQADFLDAHPEYAFVGSVVQLFDDNGYWGFRPNTIQFPEAKDMLWGPQFTHPSMMQRAQVVRFLGMYDPKAIRCEDYDYIMRAYAAGYKGCNLMTPLLDYYESDSSMKRRKLRFRFVEFKRRLRGFTALGLMPRGLIYAFKPLIVGVVPKKVLLKIRKSYAKEVPYVTS